ncbi:beta-ketoacyl-ACP synthase [Silvimonas iriomotensis]|uniref:Beta-ketoacyl-[acyl-carrier-protein] synthase II n=1 Tax=Silvimonas iriomotensis TaxID=449662 RepID=A0ABQ2PA96_9NEIS|nr:beta-ketoacyl-ACP synthase [Silvimonas iriomotensis]GGP21734.1 beta-ketoacyl-[acyl-carrier-protein] synthase II [Silvimonas iriomotensis]
MTCYIAAAGALCALGNDIDTIRQNLFAGNSPGLRPTDAYSAGRALVLGQIVDADLPSLEHLPLIHRSRNNAVLLAAMAQIRPAFDAMAQGLPRQRIAVILGTSTSGSSDGEDGLAAYELAGALPAGFHVRQQELGSPATMLAETLGVSGPAYCISTACTSGAKALAAGARLIEHGMADLVIAGGVDTLAQFTVAGFSAIESVAAERCQPSSANRHGINLGEAAALFILSRNPAAVRLAGWGESSDAHHISAPAPDGRGARAAMTDALARAGINADQIGYVNLHGTATPQNDAMENTAVADRFPGVPASSTKSLTGHTLGTAGALEALFCWLALTDEQHRLPPHIWDGVQDPALPVLPLVHVGQTAPVRAVISNSFAFGGNNIALVLAA